MLQRLAPEQIEAWLADRLLDPATLERAGGIVEGVRTRGEPALREYRRELDRLGDETPLWLGPETLARAFESLSEPVQGLLQRVAGRIGSFAKAQMECLLDLDTPVPGGRAGHRRVAIRRVGCYVPGGRYPLPSTALMTVVTARAAGCPDVVAASPSLEPVLLGALHVAGAGGMLVAGGAHAIAGLAYGLEGLERRDMIVGPGNRWVTAAKYLVATTTGIDLLAGPSELVILADENADPGRIAADLLAQAEHDPDARPVLVSQSGSLLDAVQTALKTQLPALDTAATAGRALQNGAAILTRDRAQSLHVCNRLAPEHLELHCRDAAAIEREIHAAGCVFVGSDSAEVFGDYGIGPNHTLPTGGAARYASGLSVFHFLRIQTWLQLDSGGDQGVIDDTAMLAGLEGLSGHRAAALQRRVPGRPPLTSDSQ